MTVGKLKEILKDYDDDMSVGIESKCYSKRNDGCVACRTMKNLHAKKVRANKLMSPFVHGEHCIMLSTADRDTEQYCLQEDKGT